MRKLTFLLAVGLLALTACTETGVTTSTTALPTTTISTSTSVAPPDDHLDVWVDGPRHDLMADAGARFAEAAGVTVDVRAVSFEEILESVLAGQGPDVFIASHEHLSEFLNRGAVLPVELGPNGLDLDPFALEAVTSDGVVYGVPFGMEAVALFENTAALRLDIAPESFAAAGELCAAFDGCVGVPEGLYHNYGFLSASGGYLFGTLTDGGWSVTDIGIADGVGGADVLGRLVADGIISTGTYTDLVARFARGDLPFLVTGPWQVAPFEDAGISFTVHALPMAGDRVLRPMVGVQAFFVSSGVSPDLAESFVREVLATPEVLSGSATDGRVSAYLPARSTYGFPAFATSVDGGDLLPGIPQLAMAWDPLDGALDEIYAGLDPSAAMEEADATIRAMLSP